MEILADERRHGRRGRDTAGPDFREHVFSETEGLTGMESGPSSNASALLGRTCRLRILDFGDKDCRSSRSEILDVPGRVLSLR